MRYPSHLRGFYYAELQNLRDALTATDDPEQTQVTGLRIALTTQLNDDAQRLRDEIARNLVLTALAQGEALTPSLIVKRVTDKLHLGKLVHEGYVETTLALLVESGHISQADHRYSITPAGRDEVARRTESGSEKLLHGKLRVRETIQDLTALELPDEEFDAIWKVIQDGLANMFLSNGLRIIEGIGSVLKQESTVSSHEPLLHCIRQLASRIGSLGTSGPRSREIAQAVEDMFSETTSYAFDWLTHLCTVYIGVCSLGLEPTSQHEVTARLRELDLLLDTDVVLSYLSAGEPQHRAIKSVLAAWKRINGRVFVSTSVLEEAAYHAWISDREYTNVWRQLRSISDGDALHLINNAFVRGFRAEAAGKFHPAMWSKYISQFCGTNNDDYTRIRDLLQEEGIPSISDESGSSSLVAEISTTLADMKAAPDATEWSKRQLRDKCKRDGRLVCALAQLRDHKRNHEGGSGVIISSSTFLETVCKNHRQLLGDPEPVIPIGALGFLLTLVPGVQIGLDSLAKILFDVGLAEHLAPVDQLTLRVLHASTEYSLPWSRRGTLKLEVRNRIGELAVQRGLKRTVIEKELLHDDEGSRALLADIVADSVDRLAKSASEKQVDRLEAQVRGLKTELENERARRRT